MGIVAETAQMISSLPIKGASICELGDQYHRPSGKLAKEWYLSLGCKSYVSIDGNDNGDFNFDLNNPIPFPHDVTLHEVFDVVTDIGTGEHVFNQAQVWTTLHYMCKVGGYIVFDRPHQGYLRHGFYNCNMELFTDIAKANKYEVIHLESGNVSMGPEAHQQGTMIRGVYKKVVNQYFIYPQQSKYSNILKLPQRGRVNA